MIEVRRVTSGDESLWLSAVESVLSADQRDDGTAAPEDIAAAVPDHRCYLLLALSEGTPVGLLSAYAFPDLVSGGTLAYLYDVEVAATHRRSGIGRSLIEALLDACRADGVKRVWAGTELANAPARHVFERTGADLVGERYAEYEWAVS